LRCQQQVLPRPPHQLQQQQVVVLLGLWLGVEQTHQWQQMPLLLLEAPLAPLQLVVVMVPAQHQ
jgi:hypothetical protein